MTKRMDHGLNPAERRATLGLAGVYGTRMLGLFLILPVFALYAETLPGTTPLLTGLAIGIYGLTQALLQVPFGLLSDRLGRKPVILVGLTLFALGSVVAASAEDILWIVAGRALQGSGAVAAAIMALAADLTREEQRTKIMATIGMTIGLSFMLAMIAGPALDSWVGVPGIFWITTGLALTGMALIAWVVPTPLHSSVHRDAEPVPTLFRRVLTHADLLRLDLGIFSLHLILTALFLAVPLLLRDAGVAPANHALVYLPIMLIAIAGMVPFVILSEKGGHMKGVFLGAIGTLGTAQLLIWGFGHQFWPLVLAVALFFVAFNLLEALLPSLVSKTAPPDAKGTAMGVYSTSQFTGAFAGGVLGGYLHQHYGVMAPFLLGAGVALVWLFAASSMCPPRRVASELLHLSDTALNDPAGMARQLQALPGVVEAVVVPEEGVACLKVDREHFERARADAIIDAPA